MFKQLRSALKIFSIVFLCLVMSSCSTFSFLFERLPWLSSWQLSRVLDLDNEQEELVEDAAEEMKIWFIEEGFPSLVHDLQTISSEWDVQPSAQTVQTLFSSLNRHLDLSLEELAPKFAPMAIELEEYNLEHFKQYMEEKREDWFDSLRSEEDKEDSRVERLENYFGDLTDAQVNIVREFVSLLPDEREIRQTNSEQWVSQFIASVRAKDQDAVAGWLADPSVWWSSEYTALREQNRQQIDMVIDQLIPTLSERQANHAREEIQDWIKELEEVIQEND